MTPKEAQKLAKDMNKGKCLCNKLLDCPCPNWVDSQQCNCCKFTQK